MCNTKICKMCGKTKPIEEFYIVPSMKDRHDNKCKECRKIMRRKRDGVETILTQTEGTIKCPVCQRDLDVNCFDLYAKSKTGRMWICSKCYKEHKLLNINNDKNYFRKLRLKVSPEYRAEINQQKKKSREAHIEQALLTSCKYRAEHKGLEFNLDISDIIVPEKCPILDVPFVFGTKSNYAYSPSIDRIDNSKGYIKGNVRIISMKANQMKNSATPEEIRAFCKNIKRYSPIYAENEGIEQENKESLG